MQFPTQSVRDSVTIERSMNDALVKLSISDAMHQRLVGVMRSFFQETLYFRINLGVSAGFPSSLSPDDVAGICLQIGQKIGDSNSEQLQSFTNPLFLERLKETLI